MEPLKKALIEYYRIKFNPNIEMNGLILDQLGFKQCRNCHSVSYQAAETLRAA